MHASELFTLLEAAADALIVNSTPPAHCAAALSAAITPRGWDGTKPNAALYLHAPRMDGKFVRNFTGIVPKTAIFADNFFELEALRLLKLYKDDEKTAFLCAETEKRLSCACFGSFCPEGECVGASVAALRFYTAVQPGSARTEQLADRLCAHYAALPGGMGAYTRNLPRFYFFLAMTDADTPSSRAFLRAQEPFLRTMLTRGCLTGPAVADTYNPRILYILRNALAALPEYAHIKTQPVVIREDGRCILNL